MNKENYRPVSILPITSKIFDRSMHNQLTSVMDGYFKPVRAAFRKEIGRQSTLLRLLEDWRKSLDNHECIVAILMDLSKAFGYLPHGLPIAKLRIILMGKRELVALLNLSPWCLVMVERLFLTVLWDCLRLVIVIFPDHTHLLFLRAYGLSEETVESLESYLSDSFQHVRLGPCTSTWEKLLK